MRDALIDALLYAFYHPMHVVLYFSCIATALAALAWGRPGAITAVALAPSWGAAVAIAGILVTKRPGVTWDHLNLFEVVKTFLGGTAIWLVAAIPGTLMGLAIRALIKGRSQISKET
jgi:hypothetical protein